MLTIKEAIDRYPHKTAQEIAAMTGKTKSAVYQARKRLEDPDYYRRLSREYDTRMRRANGQTPRSEIIWPEHQKALLCRLWPTQTAAEIAQKIGRTRNAVIGMANRLKLPRKRYNKGINQAWKQYRRDIKQIEAQNGKSV